MKIVLTGSTGFTGSEVLKQCCGSPAIDSIVVLSRRQLEGFQRRDKVQVVTVGDFKRYSAEILQAVADADACIWYG